jgi:predicted RNA-binding protein with RPS1 domain
MIEASFAIGGVIKGKVVYIRPFGAIMSLPGGNQGLVHISHIADSYVQNIADYLTVGDVVPVKVLSVDSLSGKIALSIKEAKTGEAEEPEADTSGTDKLETDSVKPDEAPKPVLDKRSVPETSFEDKFKEWLKASNERQAGINRRNKKR